MMYAHIGEIRAQAELTDGAGRCTSNLRPTERLPPTSSLHSAHTAADGGSATAVRGAALRRVSGHAGPTQQWWQMCREIHIFNVGRQAGVGDAQCLHWSLQVRALWKLQNGSSGSCRQVPPRDDLQPILPVAGNTGHGLATQASVLETRVHPLSTVLPAHYVSYKSNVWLIDYSTGRTNGHDDLCEVLVRMIDRN